MSEAIFIPDFEAALRLQRDETGGGLGASPPPSLSNGWRSRPPERGSPFGGLMAALAVKAARQELDVEAPLRTLNVQFLAAPRFAPISFAAERLRGGRSTVFASVRATQAGAMVLASHILFGASGPGPEHRPLAAPPRPAPPEGHGLEGDLAPWFTGAVEYRFDGAPNILGGQEDAIVRGWFRVRGAGPLDDLQLCFLLDAVFPNFFMVSGPTPVTSVDLRYDLFGPLTPDISPEGWVRFEFKTRDAASGWAVEDGTAWAPDGRPLAVARQIRKVLAKRVQDAI